MCRALNSEVLQDSRVLLKDDATLNLELQTIGSDILEPMVASFLLNEVLEILYFYGRVSFNLYGGVIPRDRSIAYYRPLFAPLRRLFLLLLNIVMVKKLLLLVCGLEVDILFRRNLGMLEPI